MGQLLKKMVMQDFVILFIWFFASTASSTGCDNAEIDLVFVLDASGSVREPNFVLVKDFVKDFLSIDDMDNGNVRVGVVIYSTEAYVQFHLNDYNSKQAILQAIDDIPYRFGSTNTADALNTMRTHMYTTANGDRPNVPNIAIVVTDGISNKNPHRTIPEAEQARAEGIHIYAIGIGLTSSIELDGIASKPAAENSFAVQKFSELQAMIVYAAFCLKTSTVQTSTTGQSKTQSTRTLVSDTTSDVLPTSEKTSEKAPTEKSNPTTQNPKQSTLDARKPITDISQMLPTATATGSPIPIPTTIEAATTHKARDTSDAIESTHAVTTPISGILQTFPSTIPNGRKDNSSAAPSTSTTNPSNTETRSTGPSFSTSSSPKYTSIQQRLVKSGKRLCTCAFVRNMTSPQSPISDVIDAIKKELTIEVSKLSSRRRRKESAIDARPSTNQIGYVSVIFPVALFCGILLYDLPKIYRGITGYKKTRHNRHF